jgi:glycosyltransferase involved in cell wall biosynthesis
VVRVSTTPRLLVIVPALNEQGAVGSVVEEALGALDGDVVVIDDGSTDRTAETAKAAGASVLRLPYNLGVGGAIRTGLRYATAHGYDRVLQLDADGQHDAREAKRLLDEMDNTGVDFVVGGRFEAGYRLTRSRRFAMRVLSRIVSRRLGVPVHDTTSGFRVLGPRAVELFSARYPVDYLSDTVEALLLAADNGLAVREVGVQMRPRQAGSPSTRGARSLYHLGRLLLGIAVRDMLRRPARGAA